jgi:hypothetical protein
LIHETAVSETVRLFQTEPIAAEQKYVMSKKDPGNEEPPPSPPKRDSFRKYLDDGCVLDSLARVVVALYDTPDFPKDPAEFIRRFLSSPHGVDAESLRRENTELKDEVKRLETRLQELKTQLGISE